MRENGIYPGRVMKSRYMEVPDCITTARLKLTLLTAVSAEQVLSFLISNREFFAPTEPARSEQYYTLAFQQDLLDKEYSLSKGFRSLLRYWITFRGRDTVIGSVMLAKPLRSEPRSCIIAYRLDKDHQGQGIMYEAASAVISQAFTNLGISRIEANIMPRNLPSRNTAARLGFREVGYTHNFLEINGVKEDHIRTELTRESWAAGQ